MYLDIPDGRVQIRVIAVRDSGFDWISEDGSYSGHGERQVLQNEKGEKIMPVAELTVAERVNSEMLKLSVDIAEIKAQIGRSVIK